MRLLERLTRREAKPTTLLESVYTDASKNVDREAGVIRNVKICGRHSQHGYEYTEAALHEGIRQYEGIDVNIEHPPVTLAGKVRPILERWGWLQNVRLAGDGAYGDLHYLKEHRDTPVILESIEKGRQIGLSHNAAGNIVKRGGRSLCESYRVRGVDLVRRGATTRTLFESEGSTMKKTLAAIAAAHKATAPDWATLLESVDSAGTLEVELAEGATDAEQLSEAVAIGVVSILESAKDFAGAQASIAKLFNLNPPSPPAGANGGNAGGSGAGAESKAMLESIQQSVQESIRAAVAPLRQESTIARVLDTHGLSRAGIGAERVKLLEACADEAAMGKLIQSWPPVVRLGHASGEHSRALLEGHGGDAQPPKSSGDVRAMLRGR